MHQQDIMENRQEDAGSKRRLTARVSGRLMQQDLLKADPGCLQGSIQKAERVILQTIGDDRPPKTYGPTAWRDWLE